MKHRTKILSAILAALMLASTAAVGASAAPAEADVTVMVEGAKVRFPDQQPVIKNDRTLVPVRFIAESLGYDVEWDPKDHTAVIDDGRIIFYIGTN